MNYDSLSPSDVALLSRSGNDGNNGFGDGNGWWIVLFLIIAMGGWNNGGFGGGNNGGGFGGTTFVPYGGFGGFGFGGTDTFASLQRQLDQGFTNLNTDINQVNNNVTQGFYNNFKYRCHCISN